MWVDDSLEGIGKVFRLLKWELKSPDDRRVRAVSRHVFLVRKALPSAIPLGRNTPEITHSMF